MYKVETTRQFRKALRRYKRSGRFNEDKLRKAVELLKKGKPLPQLFQDHQLKGALSDYRECHVGSNLLLIYRIDGGHLTLVLINLGSHPELFEE